MYLRFHEKVNIYNALEAYPCLAREEVQVMEVRDKGAITLQFVGDGNYRTGLLQLPEEKPKPVDIKHFKDFIKKPKDEDEEIALDELYYWDVKHSVNENGWRNIEDDALLPGEPCGFRPDLDKILIQTKVHCIADSLVEMGLYHLPEIYLIAQAADLCRNRHKYDQYTAIQALMDVQKSHGEYWKKVSQGILKGKDPRDRCWCGVLSKSYSKEGHRCMEHLNTEPPQ